MDKVVILKMVLGAVGAVCSIASQTIGGDKKPKTETETDKK